MKKFSVLLISLLFLFSTGSRELIAQDDPGYRFTIKTNLLAVAGGPIWVAWVVPVTGEYKLLFETKTFNKQSLQLGASYLGPSLFVSALQSELNDSVTDIGVGGFRGQLWYKFFLTRDSQGPSGFYAGPHFSYATARLTNRKESDDYVDAVKLNIHGVLGYQLITKGGFVMDIFTGVGLRDIDWEYSSESSTDFEIWDSKSQVNVTLGFSLGYAF